jgi:hypothetical protein
MPIRFFICGSHNDSPQIINATSEQEAYTLITGDQWPEDGPDDENWECTETVLQPGERLDLSRFGV